MPSRDIYKAMLCVDGDTTRARSVTRTKNDIKDHIISSLSYKQVTVNDVTTQHLEIVATDKDSKKRFTTMPDESVDLGDVILWNNMHWLVTSVDFDDEIVRRGEIEQCNRKIKWQNIHTLEIIERWCIATKPYTSNIDSNNVVSTSNREYKIKLPYDDETKLVDLDKRFMLEIIDGKPRTYKMISTDSLTNRYEDVGDSKAFIIWNLEQDLSEQTGDNTTLMICNYIEPVTPPTPEPTLLNCSISGRENVKTGRSYTYTATFYDADNVLVNDITPIWSIDTVASSDLYTFNTSSAQLTLVSSESLIGVTFEISVVDADGLYNPCTLTAEVVE